MVDQPKGIREWRGDRALSIRGLAQAAGVSPQTVVRVETGLPVRPSTIAKIAAALGVPPMAIRQCAEQRARADAGPAEGQ